MLITILKRGGILAILMLLIGGVALYAGRAQSDLSAEFADATTVAGTVARLDKSQRMQGGSTRTSYSVTVTVPGGRHRETVSGELFADLKEGQAVVLRRLDGPPARYRLDVPRLESSSAWAFGIGILSLLGGAALMRFSIGAGRKEWRLQTFGVSAQGTVVGMPGGVVPKVRVAFTDAAGTAHESTCLLPPPTVAGKLAVGHPVAITYDPESPNHAVVTGGGTS